MNNHEEIRRFADYLKTQAEFWWAESDKVAKDNEIPEAIRRRLSEECAIRADILECTKTAFVESFSGSFSKKELEEELAHERIIDELMAAIIKATKIEEEKHEDERLKA